MKFRRRLVALAQAQQQRQGHPASQQQHVVVNTALVAESRSVEQRKSEEAMGVAIGGAPAGKAVGPHGQALGTSAMYSAASGPIGVDMTNQKEVSQFNCSGGGQMVVGTAREVQSKPQDRLIMIMQKNEGSLNSVREGGTSFNQSHVVGGTVQKQQHTKQQMVLDQTQTARKRDDSKIYNSQEGHSAFKNVMTVSSNEGSASRSIHNNQPQQFHNQLSNSLQIDGSRRIGVQKNLVNAQHLHLSGSAETGNRYVQSQKQLVNSSQLSNQAIVNRRRQPNLGSNQNNGESVSHHSNNNNLNNNNSKVIMENNFGIENVQAKGSIYGKVLQNNTTGSQLLKQEIQEINKGLREAQKSQTILMPSGITQNQKSMSQVQNRLSTDNKSGGTRKPSRGNQKNQKNTTLDKNYHQTSANKLIFSTPALNTDSSQTSLPAPNNVIFHPHPLNGNVLASQGQGQNTAKSVEGHSKVGPGATGVGTGYLTTQHNKLVFNATTAIGNSQQTIAVNSARPQSQKMNLPIQQSQLTQQQLALQQQQQQQQQMNNRNSRKNLRPIGKKNGQNNQGNNLKIKQKNVSRDQYLTNNNNDQMQQNHHQQQQMSIQKQILNSHNQFSQTLKAFQSLQSSAQTTTNAQLNLQNLQQEISNSSSRERVLHMGSGALNLNNVNQQKVPQQSLQIPGNKIMQKDLIYQQQAHMNKLGGATVNAAGSGMNTQPVNITNITNKNAQFKFKKNTNSGKGGGSNVNNQTRIPQTTAHINTDFKQSSTNFNSQTQISISPNIAAANAQMTNQTQKQQSHRLAPTGAPSSGFPQKLAGQGPSNFQNTQPLRFDTINPKNQLLPGTGGYQQQLMSQRSYGQQVSAAGAAAAGATGPTVTEKKSASGAGSQKIKIPGGFTSNQIQKQADLKLTNLIQTNIQYNKILRQRSIQEQHNYVDESNPGLQERGAVSTLLNQQQDNLNQLSEIGIVEQQSKEESIINNPLLLQDPSTQQTPVYANFDGPNQNGNEISSFQEVVGAVGLSNLSEIEKVVAEGSQMSRINSSEVYININDRIKEESENRQNDQTSSNRQSNNGLCEMLKKESITGSAAVASGSSNIQQPKTTQQSARQSSINTSKHDPSKNQNQNSANELQPPSLTQNYNVKGSSNIPHKSNESSKQTTVLGSLTSNFQLSQQKKQNVPNSIVAGQSSSHQQIPTIKPINTLGGNLNGQNIMLSNMTDSARNANQTVTNSGGHFSSNVKINYQSSVPQTVMNSTSSNNNNNKLIKINKTKKMVDTARRSRIQQLDGYNTQGVIDSQKSQQSLNGEAALMIESMKLAQIQSNGPPSRLMNQKQGSGIQIPVSATNSQSKNKQLFSGSQPALNFNNTQQFVNPLLAGVNQTQKYGALMNSHRGGQNSQGHKVNSLGRNNVGITKAKNTVDDLMDNNYQSSTKNSKVTKLSQKVSRNDFQLTMKINSSQTQINQQLRNDQQRLKQSQQQYNSQQVLPLDVNLSSNVLPLRTGISSQPQTSLAAVSHPPSNSGSITKTQKAVQGAAGMASAQKQSYVRIEGGDGTSNGVAGDTTNQQQLPQLVKYQTCDSTPQRNLSQPAGTTAGSIKEQKLGGSIEKQLLVSQKQQQSVSGQGNVQEFNQQKPQIKTTPQKGAPGASMSGTKGNIVAQTQRHKTIKQDNFQFQMTKSAREVPGTNGSSTRPFAQKFKYKDGTGGATTGSSGRGGGATHVQQNNLDGYPLQQDQADKNQLQNLQKVKMNSTLKANTVQDSGITNQQQYGNNPGKMVSSEVILKEQQIKIQSNAQNNDNVKKLKQKDINSLKSSNQTSIVLPNQNEVEESRGSEIKTAKGVNEQKQSEFIHVQNQSQQQQNEADKAAENQSKDAFKGQQMNNLGTVKTDYNLHLTQQSQQNAQNSQNHAQPIASMNQKARDQQTTMDTNSNRKQTTSDSLQRTNFNTSMQNVPRGLINTAFSLSSVTSKDEIVIPALPTTPQNILRYYIQELTDYEKAEVLDYDMIYFLGKSRDKKVDQKKAKTAAGKGAQGTVNAEKETTAMQQIQHKKAKSSCSEGAEKREDSNVDKFIYNYGYDDEKGDYKVVVGDHIGYRYEIVEFLGKGSFGTALGCIDHKEKKEVAVKIVKNKKKYYYQASVELKILQYLRQHDHEDIMNVIHIEDYVVFRKHLCMSFERLSMNLFEFLKINDFNGFDHNLIRRFAIQLLYALKYLKQLEIIHCDLKPENILLKEENKSGIKIIDFGSSTFTDEKVYTYIQSRFYRAPEIMLGIPYTTAIDMWSLGCIMAELYIGYPLFPGESENDQMSRIMEMRDVPPKEVLAISERKQKFFKETSSGVLDPVMLKNSKGKLRKPNGKPLDYVIGDEDDDFNDFVIKCLDWNPETRLTPDDALKHVWVLKGLPPQVLIHHQKMHNIQTPELPQSVKLARDEFLIEQQKEQEMIMKQQQRKSRAQNGKNDNGGGARDISYNPTAGRPNIQLKTPRHNTLQQQQHQGAPHLTNLKSMHTSNQKLLQSNKIIHSTERSQDRLHQSNKQDGKVMGFQKH